MTAPVVGFFNNKGGVGKTSLVYHLAWMYADLRLRVVAADLDPQANLTAAFLDEDCLEEIWPDGEHIHTVFGFIRPILRGLGDVAQPQLLPVALGGSLGSTTSGFLPSFRLDDTEERVKLLAGDLALSQFEDNLSDSWPRCMDGKEGAFRVVSAFWRMMQKAGEAHRADLIVMDLGPNLGAINRAALIAADYVVIPLSADLFSLQGLRNLGPTFRAWREQWKERIPKNPAADLSIPDGRIEPAGYVILQHSERLSRPAKACARWGARIPGEYRQAVLDEAGEVSVKIEDDPLCLGSIKHYRSLMPMAQEARKPVFFLKAADGAIGAHAQAAHKAYMDFRSLAFRIAHEIKIPLGDRGTIRTGGGEI